MIPDTSPSATVKLQPHPYADIFPMIGEEDFKKLKADIKAHGFKEPGLLFEGKILDGRNRYRASCELGIEMDWAEVELGGPEDIAAFDALAYVMSLNLYRRHLTTSQRAFIAASIADLSAGGDRKSEDFKGQKCTLKEAAERLKVSERTVKNAKAVIASGDDELIESVKAGDMKVGTAVEIIKDRQPKEKPTQRIEEAKPRHAGEHTESEVFAIGKADVAITQLKGIPFSNEYRLAALDKVIQWATAQKKVPVAKRPNRKKGGAE